MLPARRLLVLLTTALLRCDTVTTREEDAQLDPLVGLHDTCPTATEMGQGRVGITFIVDDHETCEVDEVHGVTFLGETVFTPGVCCFTSLSTCLDCVGRTRETRSVEHELCLSPTAAGCPSVDTARPLIEADLRTFSDCADEELTIAAPDPPTSKRCDYLVHQTVTCTRATVLAAAPAATWTWQASRKRLSPKLAKPPLTRPARGF